MSQINDFPLAETWPRFISYDNQLRPAQLLKIEPDVPSVAHHASASDPSYLTSKPRLFAGPVQLSTLWLNTPQPIAYGLQAELDAIPFWIDIRRPSDFP